MRFEQVEGQGGTGVLWSAKKRKDSGSSNSSSNDGNGNNNSGGSSNNYSECLGTRRGCWGERAKAIGWLSGEMRRRGGGSRL